MNYWLMKSEPDSFSLDDLQQMPNMTEHWDGVRNYQARNFMRDTIKVGDGVLFYHSNCKEPSIVGLARVVREGYPDHTALDPREKHFDPKATNDKPLWFMVDVQYLCHLSQPLSRDALRQHPCPYPSLNLRPHNSTVTAANERHCLPISSSVDS